MNILITRHDKIGDFIVTLPLIKSIKTQFPNYTIYVLVSKINYQLAQDLDFIDGVILYDKDNFWQTLKDIRKLKFDISISAYIDTQLGWLLFLSRIKKRIAPATKMAQIFFNYTIAQRRSRVEKKEFEYNLELGVLFDNSFKPQFQKPLIDIKKDKLNLLKKEFYNKYNIDKNKKLVAFHTGFGGSSDSNLELEDYIKLAKSISNKKDIQIIFTFGPDDLEAKIEVEKLIDFNEIVYESKGKLIEFCELLALFEIFVSTSTGPMHLAGAVNITTLSFFGANLFATPARWATISDLDKQNNFVVPKGYDKNIYLKIEKRLKELVE